MAKTKKKPAKRTSGAKPASRAMAVLLVLLMAVPLGFTAIVAGIEGVRALSDRAAGIEGDAEWLMDLLMDAGCPRDPAKSIALRMRDEDLLPATSIYYIPEGDDPAYGSAVMTTSRHMVSAAVQDGKLYAIQVTDPYQNQSLLVNAGMDPETAWSAAEYLHGLDAGLLSQTGKQDDGTYLLSLPDGQAVLSGGAGDWSLTYRKEGGQTDG